MAQGRYAPPRTWAPRSHYFCHAPFSLHSFPVPAALRIPCSSGFRSPRNIFPGSPVQGLPNSPVPCCPRFPSSRFLSPAARTPVLRFHVSSCWFLLPGSPGPRFAHSLAPTRSLRVSVRPPSAPCLYSPVPGSRVLLVTDLFSLPVPASPGPLFLRLVLLGSLVFVCITSKAGSTQKVSLLHSKQSGLYTESDTFA